MLSIQAVRSLPRLRAPGIVPCIISFSRQLPCFFMVWPQYASFLALTVSNSSLFTQGFVKNLLICFLCCPWNPHNLSQSFHPKGAFLHSFWVAFTAIRRFLLRLLFSMLFYCIRLQLTWRTVVISCRLCNLVGARDYSTRYDALVLPPKSDKDDRFSRRRYLKRSVTFLLTVVYIRDTKLFKIMWLVTANTFHRLHFIRIIPI